MNTKVVKLIRVYSVLLLLFISLFIGTAISFADDVQKPGNNTVKDDRIVYKDMSGDVSAYFGGCYIIGLETIDNPMKRHPEFFDFEQGSIIETIRKSDGFSCNSKLL